MNKQRKEVYSFRNDLLRAEQPIQMAEELIETVSGQMAAPYLIHRSKEWNPERYRQALMNHFPVLFEERFFTDDYSTAADLEKKAAEKIIVAFQTKLQYQRQLLGSLRPDAQDPEKLQNILQEVVRSLMVRKIDQLWQEHLLSIDHLRADVHMRTVGQKDPLLEFKHESFNLFQSFSEHLREEITRDLFRFELMPQTAEQRLQQTLAALQQNQQAKLTLSEGDSI